MARIALAVGGAIAGALLAPFTGGLINPYTGAEIGMTLGGILGGVLFPGKLPPGPRLNDLIVSTATDGAPIPFGYGTIRLSGNIIWAPPIIETSTTQSVKGGPRQTTYSYTVNLAVAFAEGPGTVGRIWFDSKVVYSPGQVLIQNATSPTTLGINQNSAAITGISETQTSITVQSTLDPPVGSLVALNGVGGGYDFGGTGNTAGGYLCTESTPTAFILFSTIINLPTLGAGGTASFNSPAYPVPVIYAGTEAQGADPTIQAQEGAATTPAYRGLIYCVFSNFPLSDFGNRIPNIRAEITFNINTLNIPVTPSFIQATAVTTSGNTGSSAAFNSPNTEGSTLIVQVTANSFDALGPQNPGAQGVTVSDTQGNVYQQIGGGSGGNTLYSFYTGTQHGKNSAIFLAYNVKPGANTVTCVIGSYTGFSAPVQDVTITLLEYSGSGLNISPLLNIQDVAYTGSPYPNPYGPTVATTQAGQVVLYITGFGNGSDAAPAGGTNRVIGVTEWTIATPINQQYSTTIAGNDSLYAYALVLSNSPSGGTGLLYTTLDQIVEDICLRAGLSISQINTTALASTVAPAGYAVTRPSTGQSCLQPLCQAYFFDGVETGGQLTFVLRGGATQALTIPESDLGLYKDNYEITEGFSSAQDLPKQIQVLFSDKVLDYQQNHTYKSRNTRIIKTRNQSVYELPLVITATQARELAQRALFLAYLERHTFDFNTWKALYLLFDPTDVIQFTYEGNAYIGRISKTTLGMDLTVAISAINENASNYTSIANGSSGTGVTPASGKGLPNTVFFLFDIPLLRDTDSNPSGTGYYFGLSSIQPSGWPGGILEESADDVNWTQEGSSTVAAGYGYATTILGAPRSPWSWDTTNSLTLQAVNGTLAGTSLLNVLNGANSLIVGGEIIQFANCVQNIDGTFTISMLTRGRRGTEQYCGTHGAFELVVFLNNPGFLREQQTSANLGVQRYYEGISYGQTPGSTPSQLFTNTGNDLRPYAVTSVAGTRDGLLDLTVTWIRRTRIGGDWLEGIGTVPLSETVESYDIDILNGATVVRTFAAQPSPTFEYTAAQQIADFGSTQSSIGMNIYQNSSVIGRGFVKNVTL